MNRIKHLIFVCILIILIGATVRGLNQDLSSTANQQAQAIELVPSTAPTPAEIESKINKNILIDDHDVPIVVTPKPVQVKKPYITAESYLVANLETGEIYLSSNPKKVVPIASVSKLYTALVVHHLFDQNTVITIDQASLDAYGNAGNLMIGEKFLPKDLLHILLMVSSNDAAVAFAETFGADNSVNKFIEQMNAFAQEIGMKNTYFKDSSGLSSQNVSNATDLLTLSSFLYKNEKDILDISKTKEYDIATTTEHGLHHLVNINPFSTYPSFAGGKTGRTTEAKEAMVSMFNQKVKDITYPIVVIVLRSDMGEREINTEKLVDMFMNKVIK